ncbi:MAG: hypothetical protein GY714_25220 [Desulfobacterales bacterium]|nr:hypothetical protein [Desulfobacterales bacterium]
MFPISPNLIVATSGSGFPPPSRKKPTLYLPAENDLNIVVKSAKQTDGKRIRTIDNFVNLQ